MGKVVLVENVLDWQIPRVNICLCYLIAPTLVWLYKFLYKGLSQDDDISMCLVMDSQLLEDDCKCLEERSQPRDKG